MKLLPRRGRHAGGAGFREARAEHERSEKNLREAQDILEALREIRRQNHIAGMITRAIQQRAEEGAQG